MHCDRSLLYYFTHCFQKMIVTGVCADVAKYTVDNFPLSKRCFSISKQRTWCRISPTVETLTICLEVIIFYAENWWQIDSVMVCLHIYAWTMVEKEVLLSIILFHFHVCPFSIHKNECILLCVALDTLKSYLLY
jgi:hypothetical protein